MSTQRAKYYEDLRRIRVGRTKDQEELTMRFFKRVNRGSTNPTSSYSKIYLGLSDTIVKKSAVNEWDSRFKNYPDAKRTDAIKKDWIEKFKTLDVAKEGSAGPVEKRDLEDKDDNAAKKQNTEHRDEAFESFMEGKVLSKAQYVQLGKRLQAKHGLKRPPSNDLLEEMGKYRRILGPLITPFDFYKWDLYFLANTPDEALPGILEYMRGGKEEKDVESDVESDGESDVESKSSEQPMSKEAFLKCFLSDEDIKDMSELQEKWENKCK